LCIVPLYHINPAVNMLLDIEHNFPSTLLLLLLMRLLLLLLAFCSLWTPAVSRCLTACRCKRCQMLWSHQCALGCQLLLGAPQIAACCWLLR
jgi:hypothetical protein